MKLTHNTFFTSDQHFFHKNVIEFDKRPFQDLEHMHEVLINNYNSCVTNSDVCYFLGDVGFCNHERMSEIVRQLNGTKILILGNHDKGAHAMKRIGFNAVLYSGSLVIANQIITMSHCPLRGVYREDVTNMRGALPGEHWHGEFRHEKFSLPDFGQFHLHGHVHKGSEERATYNQFDVGVRANGYRPVSMSTIESWITKTLKSYRS